MYYEYLIFYVDDVLCISGDQLCATKGIHSKFKLKGDKREEPYVCLGSELSNMTNVEDQECWDMSSEKYCTGEATNVEYVFENCTLRFMPKCVTPQSCA